MMGGWMYGMGWGWIILILLLIGVVVGVIFMSPGGGASGPRSSAGTPPPHSERQAEEILKERYARGEITREEYEEMRRDLGA